MEKEKGSGARGTAGDWTFVVLLNIAAILFGVWLASYIRPMIAT